FGVLAIAAAPFVLRKLRGLDRLAKSGIALLVVGVLAGVVIMIVGGTRPHLIYLLVHAIFSFAGGLLLLISWLRANNWLSRVPARLMAQCAALVAVAALIGWGAHFARVNRWASSTPINNPEIAPGTMDGEGDGPKGSFFPSSAQTTDGKLIPAKYFMESQACERCHKDVYDQWNSSAHHFSSFNNQWY